MRHFRLVIDHELCWGCKTCEVACKQENQIPDGLKLISISENGHSIGDEKADFIYEALLCRHCEEPSCVDACPEAAIYKRIDGIVVLDSDRCTGCGVCVEACPYDSITFDEGALTARKCNLCYHRVDNGLYPACADNICLAHCIHFIMKDV